jgi:uncharacterized RDD family membrane protein YckC
VSVAAVGDLAQAQRVYASWGARLGAYLIDVVLVWIVTFVLVFVVTFAGGSSSGGNLGGLELLGLLLVVGFPLGYFIWGNGQGQTLGKKAVGIKVVGDADGAPIGYVKSFLRLLVTALLAVLLYVPSIIDYLMPLWDSKKQAIHDKAVGSVVVKA